MRIRPYVPADEAACLDIWHAASRVGHSFLGEETLAGQRDVVRTVYLVHAENWIAERDGRVLGFMGLLKAHVGGLFVAPTCHGTGVGRALIDHAFALKGPLTVEVYAANECARAFYARCGFVEIGRKPTDDEGRPFPLVRLWKHRRTP